jgi:hypothetical protein
MVGWESRMRSEQAEREALECVGTLKNGNSKFAATYDDVYIAS